MVKRQGERPPPNRSPERWAREFVKALRSRTGARVPYADAKRIASRDNRLRERVPASVVLIVEGSAEAAGLSETEWVLMGGHRQPWHLVRQKREVERGFKELRRLLDIGQDGARRLVRMEPALVCYTAGGLARRLESLRGVLRFGPHDWRRCVKCCPAVLAIKRATLAARVRSQRRVLGLTLADYRKVVMREPRLLLRSPDAIARFLEGLMRLWGLPRREALALMIKAPKLLVSGIAGTMDDNLSKLARGFGCEKAQVVKAVQSFPMLAYQNPARLIRTLKTGASVLGVSQRTLAGAVLRSPSLLARRPEGWARRMRLVLRIARALGVVTDAAGVLEMFPAAMTYATGRLVQCYVIARLGLWTWNWPTLLTYSDGKARKILKEYFKEHRERAELRAALSKRGLV
jgi:hypothetical protein